MASQSDKDFNTMTSKMSEQQRLEDIQREQSQAADELAKVYEYDSVSVSEVCITTHNESVSVFALGKRNFWSTSPVLAVYRNVTGIP